MVAARRGRQQKSAPPQYGSSMATCAGEGIPCRQFVRGYPRAAFIRGGPNLRGAGPSGLLLRCEGATQQQAWLPLFFSRFDTVPLTRAIDMCESLVQGTPPAPAVLGPSAHSSWTTRALHCRHQSSWKGGTSQQMIQCGISYISPFLPKFQKDDEDGQTLVEYGLLLALIAIIVIVA